MKIANPAANDLERVKYLWKYCFGDSDAFIDYFFANYYKRENTLAVFDGDKIASYLMIFPNELSVSGKIIKAAYIAGVCTDPLYRGKGHITRLMSCLDEKLKNEGYEAAFLIPFNFKFYKKYGYECVSYLTVYEGEMSLLENCEYGIKPQEKEKVYNEFCKNKNVYLVRNGECEEAFVKDVKAEGGYTFEDRDVFMYYHLEDDTFYARELVFSSFEGAKRALAFIKAHAAQKKKFKIRSDFSLSPLLSEKNIDIRVLPHTMAKFYNGDTICADINNYINMIGWV